jgi:hypothetical protein
MVRDLTQEVGARDGVGKTVLHCEECNTMVGLLVASDSQDWLLFLIPPLLLDDTFETIIKLREDYGWPVSKINMVLESLIPKVK